MRWVVALVLAACVQTNTRFCADGRLCPEERICDEVHMMCVSQDQIDQCKDKPDLTRCVSDVTAGQCDRGVCIPGCGDGVEQAGESCDDGGFANHDGCSSVCELEVGSWREMPKPWASRSGHVAAYDTTRGKLIVFGGLTQTSSSADAGGANDTWERDGDGTWSEITVATAPLPRQAATMAFDPLRGVTVLFGGASSQGAVFGDTWEYDGATWTQRFPAASPSPRRLAVMAYDSTRQRIVLYGGASETLQPYGDVWEYDGMTWTLRPTAGGPLPRFAGALAYDDSRDRLVLFSGSRLDQETWELAPDNTWSLVSSSGGPKERFSAAMTYDPIGQRVLLFGGDDILGGLNDLWAWNGASWTVLSTPRTPPPRRAHTFTWAGASGVLVTGAANNSDEPLDDVWTYSDALGWRLENLEFTPPPRSNTPLIYDPMRDELVMYGGLLLHNDTWTFDGTRWFAKTTQTTGLRNNHSAAWDAARQRVVIFGGLAGGTVLAYDDTWAWDGVRWTRLPAVTRPPARAYAPMAGNAAGVLVMYGGGTAIDIANALFDTWELEGTTWRRIETVDRPGSAFGPAMVYDPIADRMVMFDGDGATWTYRNGAWTLLVPASGAGPGPRNFTTLVYHEARARIMMYGGAAGTTVLTDLWELDGTTWRRVNAAGQPPAAQYAAVAYHRTTRTIVLFGGARSNALDQTWAFRHESALPDEVCTGGTDEDLDGLVDCDDPDCIYHACPN